MIHIDMKTIAAVLLADHQWYEVYTIAIAPARFGTVTGDAFKTEMPADELYFQIETTEGKFIFCPVSSVLAVRN